MPARRRHRPTGLRWFARDVTLGPAWLFKLQDLHGNDGMLRSLGLGLLVGTGLASGAWAQGAAQFDGQYRGELTLTKIIDGDCTRPPLGALYPLRISGGEVRFDYVPRFGTTLTGKVAKNGTLTASARLRRGFVKMTGRIQRDNITAYITSPSCKDRKSTRLNSSHIQKSRMPSSA